MYVIVNPNFVLSLQSASTSFDSKITSSCNENRPRLLIKKTSLLQYVVKMVKASEPDLLKVGKDLPSIRHAKNVDFETLASVLKEMEDKLSIANKIVKAGAARCASLASNMNDLNQTEMESFVLVASARINEASNATAEAKKQFKGVLSYFCEDPTMAVKKVFDTLDKFLVELGSMN